MTTLVYERDGQRYEATVEQLPPVAIAYLLQYGWAQSLQDSIAGRAKAVLQEIADSERARVIEAKLFSEESPDIADHITEFMQENRADIAAQVRADIEGQLNKRADAIKAGTVGTRVGVQRGSPFDNMCKKVATEMLLAALKAKNTKRPKPEAFDALLVQVLEKHKSKIEAEATRRIDAANTIGLDVDIEA